jgi:plastocyanin
MQFSATIASVLLLSSAAMASNATVHVVQVGLNSSLTFSPSNIQAEAGEIIQFQFLTKVCSLFVIWEETLAPGVHENF